MKARILVIEDEMSINDLLCMNLEIAGYETVGYLDGNEAYEAIIQDHAFQCALVDIMLPGRDGYSLLPKLKQYEIPVIFLTAKGDIASKIKGLKDGAEDYIVKPFEMLEVMVRLEKVLERNGTVQEQIQIGDVIIDTASRTVTKLGMEIYLKPMEYNCLMVFAKNPNKALTRNQILQELWNEEFCGETRTVDAHVGRIRKTPERQEKALIYIENECRRLSRLSMKMLELTGLYEASEDSFNPAEIQVDNFLKEVKELIDCRLQEKNISLDVFCEPKELVKKFDQDLMISVVTNLIDNAVKASRKESKIVLEATPDHLMVQDFGKGIPKEDLEMVTEPFYMVDKSRSRAKGSVGLGLSLCQKIIELHDFQLKIESNPGKGTTVSVFW